MELSNAQDDTMSLERNSSLGSDTSLPFPPTGSFAQPKDRHSLDGSCTNMVSSEGGEKEEELDSITDVPAPSSVLRGSMRPLSPFRRHSWGPGKNATNEAEINQRSLEGLTGDSGENKKPSTNLEASSLSSKDLRRSPLASNQSLVLLTEEMEQGEIRDYNHQVHQTSQPQGFNFCSSAVSSPLTKSMSLMSISKPVLDTQGRTRPSRRISFSFSISPLIPKSKTLFSIGSSSSDEEEELDSTQSFGGSMGSSVQRYSILGTPYPGDTLSWGHPILGTPYPGDTLSWGHPILGTPYPGDTLISEESSSVPAGKGVTKVSRTFSYLRNKMSSSKKSKWKLR
ncbi:hypothetical protein IHE44_0002836 [Lamprotornis superbus]|uniref:Uncharacterized protein n=1 Tax=Lamprotornis superbus TaxID=245042 RepID=A0A835U1R9_9PASS|nr:hypothetical protein IHE44_0002836 [Lamprotornis superbus]